MKAVKLNSARMISDMLCLLNGCYSYLLETAEMPESNVRIINVSSPPGGIIFNTDKLYKLNSFRQSKLASVVFTKGLAKRFL